MSGFVSLVGAGPGDAGLITVLGARRLAEADLVVYDRLANPRLLENCRPEARLLSAGKRPGAPEMMQDEINHLLVREGLAGRRVVRLKGGDPYVFGRGGEEAMALREAGVTFEVIPGITSAIAAPAYAGIPVTHRNVASSFAVITGHEDPLKETLFIDWEALAKGPDTLVFLMGVKNLPAITSELVRNGRDPSTPVALVRWGTTPQQATLTGTLVDIAERAAGAKIKPPVVTVVGRVVELRAALGWFEGRPLFGKTALVTRARAQASELRRLLEEQGAEVIELPIIEIVGRADGEKLADAIGKLTSGAYSWTVFTSANGVDAFFDHLREAGSDARAFGGCRIAAIGPGTAAALETHGLRADVVPEEYIAEGVASALAGEPLAGRRVLLPRAESARRELIDGLTKAGAIVDEVTLYHAAKPSQFPEDALRRVRAGEVDIVTFASSSTVRNLVDLLGGDISPLASAKIASIGPITTQTAREARLTVDIEAKEHTIPGLVEAIRNHFSPQEVTSNA
ncbi:MAG: uroporphyrinogen-III C-methyltransferase [Dehalococcoidia bacterium]